MKSKWYEQKIKDFLDLGGYQKPELQQDSLKLDSNENYVISKQFHRITSYNVCYTKLLRCAKLCLHF